MRKKVVSLVLLGLFCINANATPVQECMVKAKIFQNPSALAGAAEICMQGYFASLEAQAKACRADAATKTFADASYAACQASLIFDLREQVDICKDEARDLLTDKNDLTVRVSEGANSGCTKLAEQATEICRDNANKFSGLAQSAAMTACEGAGL